MEEIRSGSVIEHKAVEWLVAAVFTAIITVIVQLFRRVNAAEIEIARLKARDAQFTTTAEDISRRLERLAEQMIDLGREMSGVAATLNMVVREKATRESVTK